LPIQSVGTESQAQIDATVVAEYQPYPVAHVPSQEIVYNPLTIVNESTGNLVPLSGATPPFTAPSPWMHYEFASDYNTANFYGRAGKDASTTLAPGETIAQNLAKKSLALANIVGRVGSSPGVRTGVVDL
jgi:hypothetical protein